MGADSWDKGRLRSIWIRSPTAAAPGDLHTQQQCHHAAAHGPAEATGGDHHTCSPGSNLHHHHHRHTHIDSSNHNHHQQQHRMRSRSRSPGSPSKGPAIALLQAADPSRQKQRPVFMGALDREVLANALACAGASMADPLMSMVDTYYSGKLGTTALAALGSNGALFSVMYFLCFTALAVLTVQAMASANSRGDAEALGRGFLQSLAATAAVSTFLVVLLLAVPEAVLSFFQTNAEVMPYAKTYLMIRALSLPAALAMNVCQAAFRSLLDLTTPFAVVMTANAANALFDQLLMVGLGWGMAGCGWASVISQYIGALLFAAIIYRRRHKFGIPEALAGAADRWLEAQEAAAAAAAEEAAAVGEAGGWHSGSGKQGQQQQQQQRGKQRQLLVHDTQQQQHKQQQGWRWRWWQQTAAVQQHEKQQQQQRQHAKRDGAGERAASGSIRIHVGSPPHRVTAGREHSGSLKINMSLLDQHNSSSSSRDHSADVAGAVGIGGDAAAAFGGAARVQRRLSTASAGGSDSRRTSMDVDGLGGLPGNQQQQAHEHDRQGSWSGLAGFLGNMFSPRASSAAAAAAATAASPQAGVAVRKKKKKGSTTFASIQGSTGAAAGSSGGDNGNSDPLLARAADGSVAAGSAIAPSAFDSHLSGLSNSSNSGSGNNLRRLDSVGSDSKLPRFHSLHSWQRLLLLLQGLDWRGFVRRFAGMTARGLLILSTYSSASVVAAKAGTAMLAAHQVVQQQQQLQMSFAWSFLHVGQSMTANIFHAAAPGGGAKAARRLALRIIAWAASICGVLALLTYRSRHSLSGIFTADAAVRALVSSAGPPASLMLGLAWNNALEGCLLAADDQAYVVKVYPWAVAAALTQLGRAQLWGLGLPGVWWGLATYYLVLLLGFAGRFWLYRGKI